MFEGLFAALAYAVLNLMISPLTALWLYVSLLRNKIALKKAYIVCAVSELPLIIFWAMYVAASIMTIYIILGLVVLQLLVVDALAEGGLAGRGAADQDDASLSLHRIRSW